MLLSLQDSAKVLFITLRPQRFGLQKILPPKAPGSQNSGVLRFTAAQGYPRLRRQ
jgi:hypothetical protein